MNKPVQAFSNNSVLGFESNDAALNQMLILSSELRQLYEEKQKALIAVTKAHHMALMKLAIAAEYRDDDTGTHIVRMGLIAEKLSQLLGEPEHFCFLIRLAAPMHDVGKIGVPDSVLKKPGGLTPEERQQMNMHPEIGFKMLGDTDVPLHQLAAKIALTHHEKYDGSGYPNGLRGEEIPFAGRVVALVDYFDALTMDRCYRKAFSDDVAVDMIRQERAKHFDPLIVDTFLANIEVFKTLREAVNANPINFESLTMVSADTILERVICTG
jgi:putative two-component system response regulator